METSFGNQNNISEAERAAFIKALTAYYSGAGTIREAFDAVEPGLIDRYYRRKNRYPDEMAGIEREAEAKARQERSMHHLAFEARQERQSMAIREQAIAMVRELLPELASIARGEPRVIFDAVKQEEKVLIPYPRDQIAAFKALLDTARGGFLPQNAIASAVEARDENSGGLAPLFSVNTAFTKVSAVRPDSRTITATLGEDGTVVTEVAEERELMGDASAPG